MMHMPATVGAIDEAYATCRKVTLTFAKTFYFASIFLPKPKRNACYAVYAFCRYVDDLVDSHVRGNGGVVDAGAVERAICQWRAALDRVYDGDAADTPVMIAWADTLGRYSIPRNLPEELIEGVMTDLRPTVRFETFDQLREYCYKVASVVGLMTSEIFGYADPGALPHAIDLGIAMQLTNILRDIGEDYRGGRIYLPTVELERFGVRQEEIARGQVTGHFVEMMEFQIERAHRYYDSADLGIQMLEPDSRLTVTLMSHNYRRILDAIRRNRHDVFTRRAAVPLHRKLMTIPQLWLATPRY